MTRKFQQVTILLILVCEETQPNTLYRDPAPAGFSFGAYRFVVWMKRSGLREGIYTPGLRFTSFGLRHCVEVSYARVNTSHILTAILDRFSLPPGALIITTVIRNP